MTVPIIDISSSLRGDDATRRALAAQIDRACREIGFFTIVGHGIDERLVERVKEYSRSFFALPAAEKTRYKAPPGVKGIRGYRGVGDESLSYSLGAAAPPDYKETFRVGRVDVPDDAYHRAHLDRYFAPNPWPERPAEFRTVWEAYYRAMEELSARLMRLFALGLDLPERFFDDKIDRHISHLQANLYPDQAVAPQPGQLRAGAHSDYGSLTVLRQENRPGGLQVGAADGGWLDVESVPDSFVINIGDLMAYWTNDRWRSTLHRVVNPPREAFGSSARLSLVFFHQPNHDARVECLPSCVDAGQPAKYEPTTSGAHLLGKISKSNTMGKAESKVAATA
jgi:isopenicillin N synthase-like dioxygenase